MKNVVKISIAASELGLTPKTIYNWIYAGDLKMAAPGKVNLEEATIVQQKIKERRTETARLHNQKFSRDDKGRFFLLSGEHNGKSYSGLL